MAEAKEVQKTIEKQIVIKEKVSVINLELSEDEAKFLAAVMSKVGGSATGLRGVADSIGSALQAVVGRQYFTADCWFDNDYYRDGKRCGLSFGSETSVDENVTSHVW